MRRFRAAAPTGVPIEVVLASQRCWASLAAVPRVASPHHTAGVMRRAGRHAPCRAGAGAAGCSVAMAAQRAINWSALNPMKAVPSRDTATKDEMKQEMPEIFERQPEEVDDYIRPDKTFFERLEDWWDYAVTFMSPVDKQQEWMRALHDGGLFGIDFSWGMVFLFWGAMMRAISLVPMMYANRNSLRLGRISKPVGEITNNLKKIKNDRSLSTPERRVMKDGFKRMEKALYKKNRCSRYGSFATGATTPLLVTSFLAIRHLAAYEDDLEKTGFLWAPDLTMPDPYGILPFICAGMFVTNFELNQSLNRGGRSAMSMYLRWGIRCGSCAFVWYFQSQPTCLFAYWIGLSGMGIVQPLLLRWQPFRDFFDFPDPPKSSQDPNRKDFVSTIMRYVSQGPKGAKDVKEAQEMKSSAFERIQDLDVVFDDEPPKKAGDAKAGMAASATQGKTKDR